MCVEGGGGREGKGRGEGGKGRGGRGEKEGVRGGEELCVCGDGGECVFGEGER